MTELTCEEVRDSAAEFALDILQSPERSAVAAHLLRCPACREEADGLYAVGARLLDLVPGTEPPLGFDRRVLARAGMTPTPARLRFRLLMTVAAAAIIAVSTAFGVTAGHTLSAPHAKVLAAADLRQAGHNVGEVYVYKGQPPWVMMNVRSAGSNGRVTCELVGRGGSLTSLGSFNLDHGNGSWGAADPNGATGLTGIRLVDDQGRVVATANFN